LAAFRPTRPPPGRLLRLGVVLDARNPAARLVEISRMCDRVGIGVIWAEGWSTLSLVAATIERASLGAVLTTGADLRALPATALGRPEAGWGAGMGRGPEVGRGPDVPDAEVERLELTVRDPSPSSLEAVREALGGNVAGRLRPRLAVELGAGADPVPWLGVADDVLLGPGAIEEVTLAAVSLRQVAAEAGRDPATLGVAARLPVSIGRTVAEAQARWEADPVLAALGSPRDGAIFGTLEQCHERVIALAHAGVTDLRCVLPNTADVHDGIAQLTAMTIGTVDKLVPGAPRSPAPPPPPGWGGRPRFPTGSPSRPR
jgi:hypothetical protein